jgi:hypothetical protein
MKTIDVINHLKKKLDEGYEHTSTDILGGFYMGLSKTPLHEKEDNLVYVTVLNPNLDEDEKKFEDWVEGEDYAHIKCKVLSTRIKMSDMEFTDLYECVFDVKPVEKLPEWYNELNKEFDFRDVNILDINRRLQDLEIRIQGTMTMFRS